MGYHKGLLSTALALTLAACGQSGTQSPQAATATATDAHTPEILGVVQVKFEHLGRPDMAVNATVLPSGVESQSLARVGSVSFTQGARATVVGPDGTRYLSGTLSVNNTGAARSNLTLLGVSTTLGGGTHTLGDTSLAAATRKSGTSLTATEARSVLPLNRRVLDQNGNVQVVETQADFQAYREGDLTPAIMNYMAASPYNGYAFPFGFTARSKTGTRLMPAGTAAGTVTLAFRAPPETTEDTLSSFTWIGLIVADSENRVSTDAFEPDTTRACTAAQSLYDRAPVVLATLRNVTPTDCARANTTSQSVSTVRTSGPVTAPTTVIPALAERVVAWGRNDYGELNVPADLTDVRAVAAGTDHSLALKNDGTVRAWGYDYHGQTDVPADLTGVTAISALGDFTLALKSDGTVVAWGENRSSQATVPPGLTGVKAVAAGLTHSLALKSDGTVVGWGDNAFNEITIPPGLTGVKAIAAGDRFSLALKSDGTVVAWGSDGADGETNVPALPAGVTYTAISAGYHHGLALKSDGTVVAWGAANTFYNDRGQTRVPTGLTGVKAIAAGGFFSLALKTDGTVVAWGATNFNQTNVPALPTGSTYTAISAGGYHSLAIAK